MISLEETSEVRIKDLKKKIQQKDYIENAIFEIASILTEGINKSHFLLHERKQSGS
jgi:prophage maintenance system killer protein